MQIIESICNFGQENVNEERMQPSFLEISERLSRPRWQCWDFEAGSATAFWLSDVSEQVDDVADRDKYQFRTC
jgi:hypothetical protein